jgi:hypothetical protein
MAEVTDWNYNHLTGAVMQLLSVQSSVMRAMGLGWHGPFKTKDDALAYYTANKAAHPDWKAPTGLVGNVENALSTGADVATGGTFSKITDPLGNINLGGWFIRIAEILLGLVLIGVGVAKLSGVDNAITKVVKVATRV